MAASDSTWQGRTPKLAEDGREDDAPLPGGHHGIDTDMLARAAAQAAEQIGSKVGSQWALSHPKVAAGLRAFGLVAVAALGGAGSSVAIEAAHPPPPPPQPVPIVPVTSPAPDDGDRGAAQCDPATLRYVLHMAKHGERLAGSLDAQGLREQAESVRDMTNVNRLPEDIQLCALLDRKRAQEKTR